MADYFSYFPFFYYMHIWHLSSSFSMTCQWIHQLQLSHTFLYKVWILREFWVSKTKSDQFVMSLILDSNANFIFRHSKIIQIFMSVKKVPKMLSNFQVNSKKELPWKPYLTELKCSATWQAWVSIEKWTSGCVTQKNNFALNTILLMCYASCIFSLVTPWP